MKRTTKSKRAKKAAVGRKMWILRTRKIEGVPNYLSETKEYKDQTPVLVIDLFDAKAYEEAVEAQLRIVERTDYGQLRPPANVEYKRWLAEQHVAALGWPSPSVSAKPKNANKAKVRYPVEFENAEQGDEG